MKHITRKISQLTLQNTTRGASSSSHSGAKETEQQRENREKLFRENQEKHPLGRPACDKVHIGKIGDINVECMIDAIEIKNWKRLEHPAVDTVKSHFGRIEEELSRKIAMIAPKLPHGMQVLGLGIFDLNHQNLKKGRDFTNHFNGMVYCHPEDFSEENCIAEFHITVNPKDQATSDAMIPSIEALLWRFYGAPENDTRRKDSGRG